MSNTLLIKYYADGKFKDASGVSIFQSSNAQSEIAFKFSEDLGDMIVFANIKIPYANGSNLYGQYKTQSLIMNKQVDEAGGYIYRAKLLHPYLVTTGKAYINAQAQASEGLFQYENNGTYITINGVQYQIGLFQETFDQVTYDLLRLTNVQTGEEFTQRNIGVITIGGQVLCIKELVASLDANNDFDGTLILTSGVEIKNYDQVEFKITASAPYYSAYPLIPEESAVILKAIGLLQDEDIRLEEDKQDKIDRSLNEDGEDHSVVGNINTLIENTADLPDMREEIRQNTEDIEDLKIIETFGLDIVGTMVITSHSAEDDNKLPTKEELDTFIENITGESEVEKGQAVFVHWDNYAVADKTALCLWNGTQYSYLDMTLRKAGNSVMGEIEGTYEVSGLNVANNFMVDIVAGQIKNIYRVNADGESIDIKTALDQVKSKLVNGNAVAKANADGDGRNIKDTYQTKEDGASKLYVQQYASPKALYDLNYPDYANGLFKTEEGTGTAYNKATTSTSTGYKELATLTKTLNADILLGDQNGVHNRIWLLADITENVKISVSTSYIDSETETEIYLAIQNTDWISLTSGNARLIEIDSIFDGLTTPITLPSGTQINQQITLYREVSTSATFTLLSNSTYNAYMTFNKIGFVRYNLSRVPESLTMGNSSATLDGNNNLVVSGNGTMGFEGGNTETIATEFKVPMASTIQSGNDLPISSGKVADKIAEELDIVDLGTLTFTNGQATATMTQTQHDKLESNLNVKIKFVDGSTTIYLNRANEQTSGLYFKQVSRNYEYDCLIIPNALNFYVYKYRPIVLQTKTITPSSWVYDSSITNGYPYKCDMEFPSIGGTSVNIVPSVTFQLEEALSGNFSPVCYAINGYVTIYAKEQPTSNISVVVSVETKGV